MRDRRRDPLLTCDACGLPWARVQNGCLVVKSKHHGALHDNVITLQALIALLQQSAGGCPADRPVEYNQEQEVAS